MQIRIIPVLIVTALLGSCATMASSAFYSAAGLDGDRTEPVYGGEDSWREEINGRLPATVFIKTRSQTFCRDYQFCLVEGRVYYKSMKSRDPADWRLLAGTGLPQSRKRGFHAPASIVEISVDSDELYVVSDEGRVYKLMVIERMDLGDIGARAFTWVDRLGWPDQTPLIFNDLVAKHRSWSVGTRNASVLWYEDAAGNQHHYGTMGISTLYVLSEDGREIRFADTGLPSDFSHSILGPERGAFISAALSASASTMFVIGEAGEMYTRLADFDTLGCDPMFFKYTYAPQKDDRPGADYATNFTPWALPAEDWRRQPAIPLSGKAALSSRITILQTGYGNESRELRVAGLSPDGQTGYYFKDIFEEAWRFMPAPLFLSEDDFLDPTLVAAGRGPRGEPLEASLSGSLWVSGKRDDSLSFSIPDLSIREGSCHLEVRAGDELAVLDLHPVDMWTYMKRYDPGFDGTPRLFYLTVGLPRSQLASASPRFRARIEALFGAIDLKTFACRAEATEDYIHIELPGSSGEQSYLFLTSEDSTELDKDVLRRLSLIWSRQVDRYLDDDLVLGERRCIPASRRDELAAKVERNVAYRASVKAELMLYRSYRGSAELSRWSYSVFDLFAAITFLNRVDFPKIKTVTSHGGDIMDANAQAYRMLAEAKGWTYSKLLELVDLRLREYRRALAALDAGAGSTALDPFFRESYGEYFTLAGLPASLAGASAVLDGCPAGFFRVDDVPLFPGFIVSADLSSAGGLGGGVVVLVELAGSASDLIDGIRKGGKPFGAKARLRLLADTTEGDRGASLRDSPGSVEWDGSTLRVWKGSWPFARELLFEGSA